MIDNTEITLPHNLKKIQLALNIILDAAPLQHNIEIELQDFLIKINDSELMKEQVEMIENPEFIIDYLFEQEMDDLVYNWNEAPSCTALEFIKNEDLFNEIFIDEDGDNLISYQDENDDISWEYLKGELKSRIYNKLIILGLNDIADVFIKDVG